MSEHLEPVRAFGDLRTLLRVVVRGCQVCGGEHAGTLVEKTSRRVPMASGTVDWSAVWVVAPRPECSKEAGRLLGVSRPLEWVVTPVSVEQGRVFRVVEDAEQGTVTARKRERADAE